MSRSTRSAVAVVAILVLVYCVDAVDFYLVGKLAPAIASSFAVPLAAMAVVFTASQVGLVAGALLGGMAGDRWGRKPVISLCLGITAVLTAGAALIHDFALFALVRGLTSVAIGAAGPCVLALVAGITPERWRPLAITSALAGSSLGSTLGSVIAWRVGTPQDWRAGFWACGLGLLLALLLYGAFVPDARPPAGERVRAPVAGLLGPLRGLSLALGAGFGLSMTLNALLAAWLPSFFQAFAGVPIQRFAGVAMFATPGAILGMLGTGWLARQLPLPILALVCLGAYGSALALLGMLPFGSALFFVAMVLMSCGQASCQALLNIVVVTRYPDGLRATALGAASAIGRTGALLAPVLGALALQANWPMPLLFLSFALVPMAVAVLLHRVHSLPLAGNSSTA